jgi:hypothetical protein
MGGSVYNRDVDEITLKEVVLYPYCKWSEIAAARGKWL